MAKIFVPTSIKNEAAKVVTSVLGAVVAGGFAGLGLKSVMPHQHDQIAKELKAKGHPHLVKEDHETAPAGYELLSHA